MRNDLSGKRRRHRALFISDVHLGTRACQADALLDFLREHDADTIYLVGDIIDFWRIRRGPIWLKSHDDVLQKLCVRFVRAPGSSWFPATMTRHSGITPAPILAASRS